MGGQGPQVVRILGQDHGVGERSRGGDHERVDSVARVESKPLEEPAGVFGDPPVGRDHAGPTKHSPSSSGASRRAENLGKYRRRDSGSATSPLDRFEHRLRAPGAGTAFAGVGQHGERFGVKYGDRYRT